MPIERNGGSRTADRIVLEIGRRRTIVTLPRHGALALGAVIAGLFVWSLGAGGYVLFHDTVVAELRRGARASEKGYEAQIAALRDELERVRTRRMVEGAGVDDRLAELGRRQETLEKRQLRLAALAQPVLANAGGGAAALAYSEKPLPLDAPPRALDDVDGAAPLRARASDASEKLGAGLDAIEATQGRALETLAAKTADRRRRLEQVYDAVRAPKPDEAHGRGGPFEPLPASALTFDARVEEIATEREAIDALDRGLTRVPIRTPAPGAPITSGFGARSDPFLGRPAFHAGIDFEESYGEPVRATAAGRVTVAGPSGGYGNMVEIDHGGGLTTRFGHMSSIAVVPGQQVTIGAILGRVGSTGRSTGPHLHYETRIGGEAVNPIRFLNAGRMLAASAD